jgi:hypothetical protein
MMPLDQRQRFALAAGELPEDDALVVGQLFAHKRDQQDVPGAPRVAVQDAAKQLPIAQRRAHRDHRLGFVRRDDRLRLSLDLGDGRGGGHLGSSLGAEGA